MRLPHPHTLAGAHAMDALDAAGERRFDRHIRRCQECRDEVAELREVAGRLAACSAERPPGPLRERIAATAQRTRQLPPAAGRAAAGWRAWPAGWRAWPAGRTPPLGARPRRLAVPLAGAVAVAVAATWMIFGSGGQDQVPRHPAAAAVAAVLTASDAVMMEAPISTTGSATVVMSLRERRLVFAASGLRALRPGHRYELWLMGHGRDRPVGLLPGPSHGMSGPVIATGVDRGDKLGLTVEPAPGSGHPTGAMLMVLAL